MPALIRLQGLKLCAADHARQAISADGTRPTLAQRLTIGGLAGAIAQVPTLQHTLDCQQEDSRSLRPLQGISTVPRYKHTLVALLLQCSLFLLLEYPA